MVYRTMLASPSAAVSGFTRVARIPTPAIPDPAGKKKTKEEEKKNKKKRREDKRGR